MSILEIRMQSRPGIGEPCCVPACPNGCSGSHALPVFNGDIVSNDWPLDWGAVPCCEECYEKHQRGELATADHLYRHLIGFENGDGI